MATQAYRDWLRAGQPVERPRWLLELKAQARSYGWPYLGDLGNLAHLQANRPEDHTPFSFTEWPVAISSPHINAIDLGGGMPAYRLIDAARMGRAPWVKYVNVDGKQYNVKNGWVPTRNSDQHWHTSGRTDHLNTGLGGLNVFVATAPAPTNGDESMNLIYAKGRGWARVGDYWAPVDVQPGANVNAVVFSDGNADEISAEQWDTLKATYHPSMILPLPTDERDA